MTCDYNFVISCDDVHVTHQVTTHVPGLASYCASQFRGLVRPIAFSNVIGPIPLAALCPPTANLSFVAPFDVYVGPTMSVGAVAFYVAARTLLHQAVARVIRPITEVVRYDAPRLELMLYYDVATCQTTCVPHNNLGCLNEGIFSVSSRQRCRVRTQAAVSAGPDQRN